MTQVISCSITNEMYEACKGGQRVGDERFKWSNVFRRGFQTLMGMSKEAEQDKQLEKIIDKLNFYVRRSNELETELSLLRVEKGK